MNKSSDSLAHSVHQKLMNIRTSTGDDPNVILIRYALERLLYRICMSRYSGQFVLKGAMLFAVWQKNSYRPTRDLDLLGYGESSANYIKMVFQEICNSDVEPDGLDFKDNSVTVREIRENSVYQGQRVKLLAYLGNARLDVQVDIGFGDTVVPAPKVIDFPTLLDFPAPRIKSYPYETVIAEKVNAIIVLGIINSRMKDFYDIKILSENFSFDGEKLCKAIQATFARQNIHVPATLPTAFSEDFIKSKEKRIMWNAFVRRHKLENKVDDLANTIEKLKVFLLPVLYSIASGSKFDEKWQAGIGWEKH